MSSLNVAKQLEELVSPKKSADYKDAKQGESPRKRKLSGNQAEVVPKRTRTSDSDQTSVPENMDGEHLGDKVNKNADTETVLVGDTADDSEIADDEAREIKNEESAVDSALEEEGHDGEAESNGGSDREVEPSPCSQESDVEALDSA